MARRHAPPQPDVSEAPKWERQLRGQGGGGHRRRSGSGGPFLDPNRAAPEVDAGGAVEYAPDEFTYEDPALWISAEDIRVGMQQEAARMHAAPPAPDSARRAPAYEYVDFSTTSPGQPSFPPPPPGMPMDEVGGGAPPPPPPPPPSSRPPPGTQRVVPGVSVPSVASRGAGATGPADLPSQLDSAWYTEEAARFAQDLQARMAAAGLTGTLSSAVPASESTFTMPPPSAGSPLGRGVSPTQ